ncbi:MAG: hypothetical protein LHV69_01730 [Elusimicrobia bacterium]|nr:hypothetical protein [Candidatus Obscuribacterium magneticum]
MSLRNWGRNGWIQPHKTSKEEISDLLGLAERDLKDCHTKGLSNDWRLNIAYNAALQVATAALAASGYRASREAHHYRVIQSLAFTLQAEKDWVIRLDGFRKKRNISDYERSGLVSDQEVDEMMELAQDLKDQVLEYLRRSHPNLVE